MTPAWFSEAACRGSTDLFYPDPEESGNAQILRARAAKRVCAGCPVREPCLEHALREREKDGIWGGLTVNDRKALRRVRKPQTVRTCAYCDQEFVVRPNVPTQRTCAQEACVRLRDIDTGRVYQRRFRLRETG